jgi:hypothetical protein
VCLRYYADLDSSHGYYTVSIDGSEPERLSGKNDGGQLTQLMLWSKTDLRPGRHNLTLKHDDIGGTYMSLDYFRSVTNEMKVHWSDFHPPLFLPASVVQCPSC